MSEAATERRLRLEDESDDALRARVEHMARIARVLVEACLANATARKFISDPDVPLWTEERVRQNPTVRVEYDEAVAFGDIGSCLAATRSKHWGDGPHILPLEPDDSFFPHRISYRFRLGSRYNLRFEQRKRLKVLLGRKWRPLVSKAKYHTKGVFLDVITAEQKRAIERILGIDAGTFWRACKGRQFLDLPPREVQLEFPFDVDWDR